MYSDAWDPHLIYILFWAIILAIIPRLVLIVPTYFNKYGKCTVTAARAAAAAPAAAPAASSWTSKISPIRSIPLLVLVVVAYFTMLSLLNFVI